MTVHVDIYRVVEGIEKALEKDIDRIEVWDVGAVMRGVEKEEMERRNIPHNIDDLVLTITLDHPRIEMHIHQSNIERGICIDPVPHDSISGKEQTTQPEEVSGLVALVAKQITYAYDVDYWGLSKVSAGSIAHGGFLTDYEFTYETLI